MDDNIPDTQLDQTKEKSRPSAKTSPPSADNDSQTPPAVGVPENDDYDELLSVNEVQERQIQLHQTSIRQLKSQLVSRTQTLQPPRDGESQTESQREQTLDYGLPGSFAHVSRLQDDRVYLECLLDITRVDSNEAKALFRAQCLTEKCLPWLLARLPEILCRATDERATLLHNYISTVVTFIAPERFARAALFIIACFAKDFVVESRADLTGIGISSTESLSRGLWQYGSKEAGTLGLGLDESQARKLHTLIRALRSVRIHDFSGGHLVPVAEIEMMDWTWTWCISESGIKAKFTYRVMACSFPSMTASTAVVLVRPNSNEHLPSFSPQDPNLLIYICKFYMPELSGVLSQ
ncbi:hypothetical protein NA56DRAFT_708422 [Hyaloscypha hepaticicola]|uniref:Uncharacterized protein n=1 Tax=Hyaloscypha hepaticicola TaxID=2082293 RepID=A0A2J6PS83_9HELO|nr:hypothetical protein NA56DRAFT_708422 [Hyaloscypha hepaticicola]